AEIYILDENLQPVADGDCGELYIGGVGLARGYFNRPDLTKERFIPHPFSSEPGARLYKTGDVGRYLPDSNIELLGRVDEQVKIRGFRIELGEIEAVLCQHPAVQETVVNLVVRSNANTREDVPGDKDLVAYVVLKPSQVATTEQLRLFLREKLPNYMIPSAFVMLDTLPLNPNGKVDRRAFPAPEQVRQEATKTFVAARNQIEYQLTQIWEEVLGIQPIGIKDNFFDLGGHSFLALNLFARIEAQFGKKLPLAILFQSGSVEALADILQSQEQSATHTSEDWSSLVAIKPNGSKPPFFCIHPLGGETLCYRDLAMHLESDQPVYALQPQGLDGKRSPLTRIEDMASHYIQEIRTIQPNGPYFLGGYSFGGIVAFEMAQQLYKLGERVGMLAIFDTCLPGASMRLPFLKRIPLHVSNILRGGPAFLWQSLQMWTQQIKYDIKHKVYYELYGENPIFSAFQHVKIMDANIQAVTEYVLQVYPGNMILLRTEDKNRQKAVGVKYDLQFGWGNLVAGQLDVDFVPGSHTTMLEEPHVRVLAEKLQTCLDHALAEIIEPKILSVDYK
ncbi:MAG: AMP-binding protein, partial [Fischerella sp.]|uniref:thioesterase domain-containing protein n=1 Tax=Fischerella sp. TaxID=1191 RepID=UPI0017B50DA0